MSRRCVLFISYLCLGFLFLFPSTGAIQAQTKAIKEQENELSKLEGHEKLLSLNQLTAYYLTENLRKALKYGKVAVQLGEELFTDEAARPADKNSLCIAYFQFGEALFQKERYFEAQENYIAAKVLAIQTGQESILRKATTQLDDIQRRIESGELKKPGFPIPLAELKVGEKIQEAAQDIRIQTEVKLAESKSKKGDFSKAIEHYEKAISLLEDQGDRRGVNELQLQIAFLLDSLDQHVAAQAYLNKVLENVELDLAPSIINPKRDSLAALANSGINPKILRKEQQNLKDLSETFAREKNYEKSLAYFRLYQELSEKMIADSMQAALESSRREGEILLLKQQKKIADLQVSAAHEEQIKQVRFRNTSLLIAGLILLSALITLYFYNTKRKEHQKLTVAYFDLEETKNQLASAEQKIEGLLRQQVSPDVATALIADSANKPGEQRFVCVMFLDIRNFTHMAEKMPPEDLIAFQNKVFGFMIDIVQKYNGTINQLLGDGFMATFGAPLSHGNDCQNAVSSGMEILKELKKRIHEGELRPMKIGIGLHAGNVVTGNVGNETRKQYSITGNTVIIASRVEQLNKQFQTQLILTEEVYEQLDNPLTSRPTFEEVTVKGRSEPVRIFKVT